MPTALDTRYPILNTIPVPPLLSIIIPTHNRGPILRECLKRIERQTAKDQLEVIVVSDGEPDKETTQLAKESFQVPMTFLSIPKSQQGAARNRGVQEAKGTYVLFIGDDIFLEPDACEVHLRTHRDRRFKTQDLSLRSYVLGLPAVLGHIAWDPSLDITPTMRWLEETGWQFGYSFLTPHAFVPKQDQHRFTYASHISLPTDIARSIPFREGIGLYGWEDIEWGMRLRDAGVRLFYEPDAKALHRHAMSMEDSLKRMETLGESAVLFEEMHPEMHIVPKGWKRLAYTLIAILPTVRGKHARAFLAGQNNNAQ
jgi:glycosyltransferase involved in cell wall biosynthesis